jgi:hypothetical protein
VGRLGPSFLVAEARAGEAVGGVLGVGGGRDLGSSFELFAGFVSGDLGCWAQDLGSGGGGRAGVQAPEHACKAGDVCTAAQAQYDSTGGDTQDACALEDFLTQAAGGVPFHVRAAQALTYPVDQHACQCAQQQAQLVLAQEVA